MRIVIVGSGGREHALGYKVAEGAGDREIFFLPGNAGTALVGENMDVGADDIEAVTRFCRDKGADLVIVGPEDPLAGGLSDRLLEEGIRVFGPTADCARLESDKAFAKQFMARHSIPTARFDVFTDSAAAHAHIESSARKVVVKASGLARGKGVLVTGSRAEAHRAVDRVMDGIVT